MSSFLKDHEAKVHVFFSYRSWSKSTCLLFLQIMKQKYMSSFLTDHEAKVHVFFSYRSWSKSTWYQQRQTKCMMWKSEEYVLIDFPIIVDTSYT